MNEDSRMFGNRIREARRIIRTWLYRTHGRPEFDTLLGVEERRGFIREVDHDTLMAVLGPKLSEAVKIPVKEL